LVEAAEQFARALEQIATLPVTPVVRREQIKLQVALITPLIHVKGYAAPETKSALEKASLLIEQAQALGEPPEDPLLQFSVLFGVWAVNRVAFNGDAMRKLATQYLALARKQKATGPLMNGHRVMGVSLLLTGDISEGRAHLDQAIALYEPAEHHSLASLFATDVAVSILCYRSIALWLLGYSSASLADIKQALADARKTGQASSLMFALDHSLLMNIQFGDYPLAHADADELAQLAAEKGATMWGVWEISLRGYLLTFTGKASDAIQVITTGVAAARSTGATCWVPLLLTYLARANAEVNQYADAWACISEATNMMETTTKERWCEAEVDRIAGEIALKAPARDETKADAYFKRALTVARQQQAKSWELRAAMSMARLWRDQGKRNEARDLLAPVYGWFTEGFDTLDLKEAKALLDELAA
jgi:predicted ATPase